MIKFIQSHSEGSDCTAPYDVILNKPYTVNEFVEEILKTRRGEWGEFKIKHKSLNPFDCLYVQYKYGTIAGNFPENISVLPVKEVMAAGGWGAMNYNIIVE